MTWVAKGKCTAESFRPLPLAVAKKLWPRNSKYLLQDMSTMSDIGPCAVRAALMLGIQVVAVIIGAPLLNSLFVPSYAKENSSLVPSAYVNVISLGSGTITTRCAIVVLVSQEEAWSFVRIASGHTNLAVLLPVIAAAAGVPTVPLDKVQCEKSTQIKLLQYLNGCVPKATKSPPIGRWRITLNLPQPEKQ